MEKRGIIWPYLIGWVIAIVILVFMIILLVVMNNKGTGFIEFFKNLVRFR